MCFIYFKIATLSFQDLVKEKIQSETISLQRTVEGQKTVLNNLLTQVEDQKTLITDLDLKTIDETAARTTQVAMLQTTVESQQAEDLKTTSALSTLTTDMANLETRTSTLAVSKSLCSRL